MKAQKEEAGQTHKDLKYLITSLDDMRDVISMVWGMIGANIDAKDRTESAKAIVPSSIPLRQDSGSFIINLKVPEKIWERCHANKSEK
jgi:hypothetical protein